MKKVIFLLFVTSVFLAAANATVAPYDSDLAPIFGENSEIDDQSQTGGGDDTIDSSMDSDENPDAVDQYDHSLRSSVRKPKKGGDAPASKPNKITGNQGRPGNRFGPGIIRQFGRGRGIGRDRPLYPPQCKCKAVPINRKKKSVCYDMYIPLQEYGLCKKRTCGRKYECVPGLGRGLENCIRRIATHETKLRRNEKGVLLCNTYKLKKPKVFYSLYL